MFSPQIYREIFVNHRYTGGFTYFALHIVHATFCIEPRNSLENKEIIRSVLAIFLQGTKELYKRYGKKLDEPLRREQELYRQFIQLLMAHYTKEHEVAFYAEKCGVTAAHFSSAIRRASGYSPLAIITEIIIMNAKAQLKTTRLSVKEIAFSLGFNNHSFFNKYFRKKVKMTPLEYREK